MTTSEIKTPKGLLILGCLQIFVALRGVWNFFHHQNLNWDYEIVFYFLVALLCGVVGIGLLKVRIWAYRTFVVIYVIYILRYAARMVDIQAPPALTLSKYRFDNLKAIIVCLVLMAWLVYYRKLFLRHDINTQNSQPAVSPDR